MSVIQKIFVCTLTFASIWFAEWAYAQPPRGHQHCSGTMILRGQAEPAPAVIPQAPPFHNPRHTPAQPVSAPAPAPRPVIAPPPPPAPPAPAPHKSFLQICLPFLSLGISK